MLLGLFGSTTIDCFACMEKANTHGTADATKAVIESGSTMAADITDDRALGALPPERHKTKSAPTTGAAPKLHPARPSGGELSRLNLQYFAGTRDWDYPRLHRLWDLAHEVDVQEPVL